MLVRAAIGATALIGATGCATSSEPAAAARAGAEDVVCRDILTPGSNVISRVCDTADGWRDYDRARTRESQQLVRRMQGFGG